VADSLIAVGALPVTSTLLRESPASGPGWHVPAGRLGELVGRVTPEQQWGIDDALITVLGLR
jgi:hypothetical protein